MSRLLVIFLIMIYPFLGSQVLYAVQDDDNEVIEQTRSASTPEEFREIVRDIVLKRRDIYPKLVKALEAGNSQAYVALLSILRNVKNEKKSYGILYSQAKELFDKFYLPTLVKVKGRLAEGKGKEVIKITENLITYGDLYVSGNLLVALEGILDQPNLVPFSQKFNLDNITLISPSLKKKIDYFDLLIKEIELNFADNSKTYDYPLLARHLSSGNTDLLIKKAIENVQNGDRTVSLSLIVAYAGLGNIAAYQYLSTLVEEMKNSVIHTSDSAFMVLQDFLDMIREMQSDLGSLTISTNNDETHSDNFANEEHNYGQVNQDELYRHFIQPLINHQLYSWDAKYLGPVVFDDQKMVDYLKHSFGFISKLNITLPEATYAPDSQKCLLSSFDVKNLKHSTQSVKQGWILFVSIKPQQVNKVVEKILSLNFNGLPGQIADKTHYKIVDSLACLRTKVTVEPLIRNFIDRRDQWTQNEFARKNEAFLIFYPDSQEHAYELAKILDTQLNSLLSAKILTKNDFIPLKHAAMVGTSGGLYTRYDSYEATPEFEPLPLTPSGQHLDWYGMYDLVYPWPDFMNKNVNEWSAEPNPFKDLELSWVNIYNTSERFTWETRPDEW